MAKLKFSDLMTKISYVFKADSYILDNKYILGGEVSEKENPSNIILELSPESISLIKEELPTYYEDIKEKDVFFFKDIKKAKKDFMSYTSLLKEKDIKDIRYSEIYLNDILKRVNDWEDFNFTPEEVENFITAGKSITLFENNKDIPNINISKKLIPMISIKNIEDLRYKPLPSKDDYSLNILVLCLVTEWFNIYSIVEYIDVDSDII